MIHHKAKTNLNVPRFKDLIDWYFNAISINLELLHELGLVKAIHCSFIFAYLSIFLMYFFAHGLIEYEYILNRPILLMDRDYYFSHC